ncbi:dipeptidase [Alicyclobacillus acidiphilus]|uniref:dipeptidase n=1 Tax=Alicyclobacillus acidiphilus TaxID=182455 RepID=UPI00082F352B|nr:dipeptidase [Alicyclobacillus acidiphilus]
MSWKTYLEKAQPRFLDELIEFLKIPSISTSPAHSGDVRRAVEWTENRVKQAGFDDTQIFETGGHPVLFAQWLNAPSAPTVLIYGHCDVQPIDPLALWETPPFEPTIRDGRIYARGASDMKTSVLTAVIACEAWLKAEGRLPVNVKLLIEAEEEIGSPNLESFVAAHKDLLACDLVISADSGQSDKGPELPYGVRGLVGMQIDVRSAKTDLHSGSGGGIAPNSIHTLVELLASMRAADGTILVDGFYDDVIDLDEAERKRIAANDNVAEFVQYAGIKGTIGEPAYTPAERGVARPTLEINGIWGGFQEDGVKTVIPAEAHAKITCRLVPGQTPDQIFERVKGHILKHASPLVECTVTRLPGSAFPYLLPLDHPGAQASIRALKRVYNGQEPVLTRSGGTVPFLGIMNRLLGVHTISYGFSGDHENIHAPNEFFKLKNFPLGQEGFCILFEELANQ